MARILASFGNREDTRTERSSRNMNLIRTPPLHKVESSYTSPPIMSPTMSEQGGWEVDYFNGNFSTSTPNPKTNRNKLLVQDITGDSSLDNSTLEFRISKPDIKFDISCDTSIEVVSRSLVTKGLEKAPMGRRSKSRISKRIDFGEGLICSPPHLDDSFTVSGVNIPDSPWSPFI